jgi:cytidyltransferase-like protein
MSSVSGRERKILAKVYASQFSKEKRDMESLAGMLETDKRNLECEIEKLGEKSLLVLRHGTPRLTELGRSLIIVVMAGGSFDIIHPGHIHTLERAKSLGDALVVSVARDATFRKNKSHDPEHSERLRRKLVSALRVVDAALLGSTRDILETALLVRPDIIALGYDQKHDGREIRKALKERGLSVRVVRLKSPIPNIKTSAILRDT